MADSAYIRIFQLGRHDTPAGGSWDRDQTLIDWDAVSGALCTALHGLEGVRAKRSQCISTVWDFPGQFGTGGPCDGMMLIVELGFNRMPCPVILSRAMVCR